MTSKIEKDKEVIAVMIEMYCHRYHRDVTPRDSDSLCPECRQLLDYALARLDRCPHGEGHRGCKHCRVHCYSPRNRELIRRVMRYSGPRIMLRHPIVALRHLFNL